MKININSANDKRIRECFDLLLYVCRKELNPDEFSFVQSLRKRYNERGSLTERQEQDIFSMADYYKKKKQ